MQSDQQVHMSLDQSNAEYQRLLLFGHVPDQGAEYVSNSRVNQLTPKPGCPDHGNVDAVSHRE
jgi:hypothetical protein